MGESKDKRSKHADATPRFCAVAGDGVAAATAFSAGSHAQFRLTTGEAGGYCLPIS
jgi:hypothetical protein